MVRRLSNPDIFFQNGVGFLTWCNLKYFWPLSCRKVDCSQLCLNKLVYHVFKIEWYFLFFLVIHLPTWIKSPDLYSKTSPLRNRPTTMHNCRNDILIIQSFSCSFSRIHFSNITIMLKFRFVSPQYILTVFKCRVSIFFFLPISVFQLIHLT